MAFLKKYKSLLKLWFIAFFSFDNKPWGSKSSAAGGQNRVLPAVKIECTRSQNWVHPHKHWLCVDALYFDPQQHLILTPKAYFQNWNKLQITILKWIEIFSKKKNHTPYNIPTVFWLKVIFWLGNPLNKI